LSNALSYASEDIDGIVLVLSTILVPIATMAGLVVTRGALSTKFRTISARFEDLVMSGDFLKVKHFKIPFENFEEPFCDYSKTYT